MPRRIAERNDLHPGSPAAGARSRRGRAAWHNGFDAEAAACMALAADGWHVLLRRARTEAGEIDIVVERGKPGAADRMLAFVEVKARPALSEAAASLSVRQCRRLRDAAAILLGRHPQWDHPAIRFDLVLVDAAGRIRRIADAFRDEA